MLRFTSTDRSEGRGGHLERIRESSTNNKGTVCRYIRLDQNSFPSLISQEPGPTRMSTENCLSHRKHTGTPTVCRLGKMVQDSTFLRPHPNHTLDFYIVDEMTRMTKVRHGRT